MDQPDCARGTLTWGYRLRYEYLLLKKDGVARRKALITIPVRDCKPYHLITLRLNSKTTLEIMFDHGSFTVIFADSDFIIANIHPELMLSPA